jgi:putative salt-induced outer membrane protein YdiY
MNRNHTLTEMISSPGAFALLCFGTVLGAAPNAPAADATTNAPGAAVTNAPPPKHWESVAAAALTLTRGNSRSFLGTVSIDSKGKYGPDEFLLGGAAGYGDTVTKDSTGAEATTKTQDYLKGYAQWNHLFTDRFYAGLKVDGLHDAIADINYRFTVDPMAGYYFIKKPQTELAGEIGPSYVYQQLDSQSAQSYAALRVAERFNHTFANGAKIWESVEWLAQVDKFDNWIANAELGISAPMSKVLDVRLILDDTYNNQPAPGRQKNDLKLLAGIGYKF